MKATYNGQTINLTSTKVKDPYDHRIIWYEKDMDEYFTRSFDKKFYKCDKGWARHQIEIDRYIRGN